MWLSVLFISLLAGAYALAGPGIPMEFDPLFVLGVPLGIALYGSTTFLWRYHTGRSIRRESRSLLAVLPALVVPLPEEILFRGALGVLTESIGVVGFILVSSVLFGLYHLNQGRNEIAFKTGLGVVLCLVYLYSGSILAPTLTHFGYNLASIPYIARIEWLPSLPGRSNSSPDPDGSTTQEHSTAVFDVSPERPNFDESFDVELRGLQPETPVTIRAKMPLPAGIWESWATFEPTDDHVDLTAQAPIEGTYEGVDPTGLFWSMERISDLRQASREDDVTATVVELTAVQEGTVVAETSVSRVFVPENDVDVTRIVDDIDAELYEPAGSGPHPTVVLLGGLDGGLPDWKPAMVLARHGYAVLALAYFDRLGLPKRLERISLSYFEDAFAWIDARDDLQSEPLAVLGHSRGGELALLLGSEFPEVETVIGYSPSVYVYQGVAGNRSSPHSAWRVDGEDHPCVPFEAGWLSSLKTTYWRYRDKAIPFRSAHRLGLAKADGKRRTASTIPVERIGGPVLLVTGGDDAFWPAGEYAAEAIDRLDDEEYDARYDHLHFPDAGHSFGIPLEPAPIHRTGEGWLPDLTLDLGGNPDGIHEASVGSWRRTLEYLEDGLR